MSSLSWWSSNALMNCNCTSWIVITITWIYHQHDTSSYIFNRNSQGEAEFISGFLFSLFCKMEKSSSVLLIWDMLLYVQKQHRGQRDPDSDQRSNKQSTEFLKITDSIHPSHKEGLIEREGWPAGILELRSLILIALVFCWGTDPWTGVKWYSCLVSSSWHFFRYQTCKFWLQVCSQNKVELIFYRESNTGLSTKRLQTVF